MVAGSSPTSADEPPRARGISKSIIYTLEATIRTFIHSNANIIKVGDIGEFVFANQSAYLLQHIESPELCSLSRAFPGQRCPFSIQRVLSMAQPAGTYSTVWDSKGSAVFTKKRNLPPNAMGKFATEPNWHPMLSPVVSSPSRSRTQPSLVLFCHDQKKQLCRHYWVRSSFLVQ